MLQFFFDLPSGPLPNQTFLSQVKKATILRNSDLISRCFCIKTLPYPTQLEPAKRHELHNEIRVMAQFSRKYNEPLELHNGSIRVRQGDWFSFESNAEKFQYTAEFLNTFYCCREVDRSKMPNPREWQLDMFEALFLFHILSLFVLCPCCSAVLIQFHYLSSSETAMEFAVQRRGRSVATVPAFNRSTTLTDMRI
jgi:hypothetical protein